MDYETLDDLQLCYLETEETELLGIWLIYIGECHFNVSTTQLPSVLLRDQVVRGLRMDLHMLL